MKAGDVVVIGGRYRFHSKSAAFTSQNGKVCTILRPVTIEDGWLAEDLPMFLVRFDPLPLKLPAWPEELHEVNG